MCVFVFLAYHMVYHNILYVVTNELILYDEFSCKLAYNINSLVKTVYWIGSELAMPLASYICFALLMQVHYRDVEYHNMHRVVIQCGLLSCLFSMALLD